MPESFSRRVVACVVGAALFAAGMTAGTWLRPSGPERVFAATAASDETFAACTAPVDAGMEGLFLLDFETGDLTGGVLNRNTAKFTTVYRYNVLKDLDFKGAKDPKAAKVKNPRFLLTAGLGDFAGNAANNMAQSVLYVTDAATGVTVAYGIPWSGPQAAAGGAAAAEFVPLDKASPRGGKAK